MENTVHVDVSPDSLETALSWVSRALAPKSSQPILRGILLEAEGSSLTLSAYDRVVSAQVTVNADVTQGGSLLLPGKVFVALSSLIRSESVTITSDNKKVEILAGTARFDLPLMTREDYPELPAVPEITGTVDTREFAAAIAQVTPSSANDDSLPVLTGIDVKIKGDTLTLAATDRYRLAVRTLKWNPSFPDLEANLLIPAHTLSEFGRGLDPSLASEVSLAFGSPDKIDSKGTIGIVVGDQHTTARLLEASFPPYERLLVKNFNEMALVPISAMKEALRRVRVMADDKSQIRVSFSNNTATVSAGGSDLGLATEQLTCLYDGPDIETAYNPRYLSDGLAAIAATRAENVLFAFTDPSQPSMLLPGGKEVPERDEKSKLQRPEAALNYLLMPMRLPG